MAFTYEQRTGRWHGHGIDAIGYAGLDDGDGVLEPGEGKNAPEREQLRGVGPLPRGHYQIHGPPFTHPKCGPYCLRLLPAPDTNTFGRSGFLIHGDAKVKGTASEGCIILPLAFRRAIWNSGVRYLEVVEGPPAIERAVA